MKQLSRCLNRVPHDIPEMSLRLQSHKSTTRPPGLIPDPNRSCYFITEESCQDCGRRSWVTETPFGFWYVSPLCHACCDKGMKEKTDGTWKGWRVAANKQSFLNAGLTQAELVISWKLDSRLKRFSTDYKEQCFAYLVGSTGTGKSTQAWETIKFYVSMGWRCRYLTETDLIRLLQEKVLTVSTLVEIDLLVIDEFGSSNPGHWQNDWLREIVDGRYRNRRPTVFSSNHSLRTLSKKEGLGRVIVERIFERVRGEGGLLQSEDALYIECCWSYRIGVKANLPEGCVNSPFPLEN